MAIYMKFGDTVKGQVTTTGYVDMIELQSMQFGVGRGVGSGAGGLQREGSNPSVSEITVTKAYDKASAGLYQDALAGAFNTTVNIYFSTTVNTKTDTYLMFELSACGLSGYSLSSGGDNPSEAISLNFTKVMVKPSPMDNSGTPVPGASVTYDLTTFTTS